MTIQQRLQQVGVRDTSWSVPPYACGESSIIRRNTQQHQPIQQRSNYDRKISALQVKPHMTASAHRVVFHLWNLRTPAPHPLCRAESTLCRKPPKRQGRTRPHSYIGGFVVVGAATSRTCPAWDAQRQCA